MIQGAEIGLDKRFSNAMGQLLGPNFPTDLGLAISGGGDSMAMLLLAHEWARVWGVRLWVVTVDHDLRPESAAEARLVADECKAFGHTHCTLKWHWDGKGNVQARARDARLELINRWRGTLRHVLFAHTQDDIAETYLTRLSRSAGVEGLSSMQSKRPVRILGPIKRLDQAEFDGVLPKQDEPKFDTRVRPAEFYVLRPCLDMSRAELRHYLKTLSGRWVEDPSNDNPRFDRVRMRQLQPALKAAGLSSDIIAQTAHRMARASEALRARAHQVWQQVGKEGQATGCPTGEVIFQRDGFERIERDTQMRLLSYALAYVSSQAYRPREAAVETLLDQILGGGGNPLHGCDVMMERDQVRVSREFNAVKNCVLPYQAGNEMDLWDGRWRMLAQPGQTCRALGPDGWGQISNRDAAPIAFRFARSLPSFWEKDRLLSCPALGVGDGKTRLWPMGREMFSFARFLLSH